MKVNSKNLRLLGVYHREYLKFSLNLLYLWLILFIERQFLIW